jgi:MFS transporter, ENTS family, enterobactin (siderophore) exporter
VIEPAEHEAIFDAGHASSDGARSDGAGSAGDDRSAQAERPLRSNRDFRVFLGGQGLSALGDSVTFTALPILVLRLTGSGVAMGIVGILQSIPDLVLGLPAGALADRFDRRGMMLASDLGRAVLTAVIPLTAALGGPTMTAVLLVTLPINCLRVLWLASYTAAVTGLVGRSSVGRAQSILEATFNIGFVLGPAIAGLLSAVIGPAAAIGIDAVSFVVSAGALFLIRTSLRPPARPEATHILTDIAEGIRFVVRHPVLRQVIAFWGLVSIGTGALVQALTFHIEVDRALSPAVLGIVLSAYGVGSLLGALAAGRFVGGVLGRNLLLGTGATGLLLFVLAAGPPIPIVIGTAFLSGVAQSTVLISYLTLRTNHSPDALLGRVGSTARLISIGLTPLGLLAGGFLIDATNGATAIDVMAAWMVGLGLVFAFSRTVRDARSPVPQAT